MSYKFSVIKNNPTAFWLLDETSGTEASDYSGLENPGTYSGGLTNGLLPLVFGLTQAYKSTSTKYISLPVNKNFYGSTVGEEFANSNNNDKQFSLEIWAYFNISSSSETVIFADNTNDIGIFYDKGNIVFKCNTEEISYTLPYLKKSFHIAAVYDVNTILLYIDGTLVNQKGLSDFKFTNTSVEFAIGPTSNASDSFLVNSAAIYRHSITESDILNHFNSNKQISTAQLAYSEDVEVFEIYDDSISEVFTYSYPADKSFEYLLEDGLVFNSINNSLDLEKSTGSKTVVVTDVVSIPSSLLLDSSKIEWSGENGIQVETSIDNSSFLSCTSGDPIPQFRPGSVSDKKNIYIKITFSSSDSSKYLPSLKDLSLRFYYEQRKHSLNGPNKASSLLGDVVSSVYDISLGQKVYPILSRHNNNGIRCASGSGFQIISSSAVMSIEFFITPETISTEGAFISFEESGSYPTTLLYWNSSGALLKSNISKVYVNGVDKSTATNVSDILTVKEISYISIVLEQPISGRIVFNYNYSENSSNKSLYQNILLSNTELTSQQTLDHYNFYINGDPKEIKDLTAASATLTETGAEFYNNDWVVVQNS